MTPSPHLLVCSLLALGIGALVVCRQVLSWRPLLRLRVGESFRSPHPHWRRLLDRSTRAAVAFLLTYVSLLLLMSVWDAAFPP